MGKYSEWKDRWQNNFNEWASKNAFYAFDEKQFNEGLKKLGVTTKEIYKTPYGMFYLKSASPAYHKIAADQDKEWQELLKNEDFMVDAFLYELGNHEYCITCCLAETFDALGIDVKMLSESQVLRNALRRAKDIYWKRYQEGME